MVPLKVIHTPEKRWKRFERRVADYRPEWERVPGSGAFSVGDGNVITTKADVWAPEYFIECKQRKTLPIWDQFKEVGQAARRYDLAPLIVLHNPDEGLKLVVFDMDDLDLVEGWLKHAPRLSELLNRFHVVHEVHRRRWTYGKWSDSVDKARAEEKPLLIALGKVRSPGALGVLAL